MTDWFLLTSLLFPRLTLLLCWLTGAIPPNSTPLFVDIIMGSAFPRFLIAFWAYEAHVDELWIAAHVVVGIMELSSGNSAVSKKRKRK